MMNSLLLELKPWVAWMHLHPNWVGVVAFAISFLECVALIGFFVPGAVLFTAIGSLIGAGIVSAQMVLIPTIIGAILGDALSFMLGYHYREHLRDMWPFKFYPKLLQKGESFFYRHGGKSVLAARFIGPIRPMLPLVAGMLNMSPWRFTIVNSISAIIWAPVYMLPGYLLGKASTALPPDVAMNLMLYVIVILLILWCISWLIKLLIAWIFNAIHDGLDKLWLVIKDRPWLRPLHIALQDPLHPESHAQLTLGLYFIFMGIVFGWIAWSVMSQGLLTSWNHSILFFLRSLRSPAVDPSFIIFTIIGDPKVILGVFIILLFWFFGIRAYRTAVHWGVLGILAFGGTEVFKIIVHSPRPWGLWLTPSGYSFPSGHTALSAIILGFFAVLVARELKKPQQWIPYTLVTLLVLTIAVSRLYLGAHWLTDVIGAMFFAMAVVMLVTLSYRRQPTPQLKLLPLCLVFILSWGSIATVYGLKHYHKITGDYNIVVSAKVLSIDDWWNYDGIDEPFYRLDRTGKPAQVLNVQWAGNVENIKNSLIAKGWHVSPNTTLDAILQRLNKSPRSAKKMEMPVLPPLYQEQRPVLVMTKNLDSSDSLLLLSLWNSKTRFTNSVIPLWLGNVRYLYAGQAGFFHLRPQKVSISARPAVTLLEDDLGDYVWKQLSYPFSPNNVFAKLDWDGQIVLVKPKNEGNG